MDYYGMEYAEWIIWCSRRVRAGDTKAMRFEMFFFSKNILHTLQSSLGPIIRILNLMAMTLNYI